MLPPSSPGPLRRHRRYREREVRGERVASFFFLSFLEREQFGIQSTGRWRCFLSRSIWEGLAGIGPGSDPCRV
jgi:hypothetical protein